MESAQTRADRMVAPALARTAARTASLDGSSMAGLVKVDQSGWQEMARYRLAGLDLKKSTSKTRELAHRKLDCLGAIDEGARLVEQQLPSFGHDNAASHTIEQFRAELPFE
jgi:hypothetical protein